MVATLKSERAKVKINGSTEASSTIVDVTWYFQIRQRMCRWFGGRPGGRGLRWGQRRRCGGQWRLGDGRRDGGGGGARRQRAHLLQTHRYVHAVRHARTSAPDLTATEFRLRSQSWEVVCLICIWYILVHFWWKTIITDKTRNSR